MRILAIAVIAIGITVSGCKSSNSTSDGNVIETTGTVQYVDLEGGFYGIVAENGTQYDPVNLPEDLKEEGVRVRFRAQIQQDMAGIHMWGEIVEILEIDRL